MEISSLQIVAEETYVQKTIVDDAGCLLSSYEKMSEEPVRTVYKILTESGELLDEIFYDLEDLLDYASQRVVLKKD